MFLFSGIVMLALNYMSSFTLYLVGVSCIGFCFGGFLALYPAVTADYFGTKNVGANYGWMFTAYGAGGLFGPWLAPKLMTVVQKVPYEAVEKGTIVIKQYAAGNFLTSFIISGIMCLIAVAVVWAIKPPVKKA